MGSSIDLEDSRRRKLEECTLEYREDAEEKCVFKILGKDCGRLGCW